MKSFAEKKRRYHDKERERGRKRGQSSLDRKSKKKISKVAQIPTLTYTQKKTQPKKTKTVHTLKTEEEQS